MRWLGTGFLLILATLPASAQWGGSFHGPRGHLSITIGGYGGYGGYPIYPGPFLPPPFYYQPPPVIILPPPVIVIEPPPIVVVEPPPFVIRPLPQPQPGVIDMMPARIPPGFLAFRPDGDPPKIKPVVRKPPPEPVEPAPLANPPPRRPIDAAPKPLPREAVGDSPLAERERLIRLGREAFRQREYGLARERFEQARSLDLRAALPTMLEAQALVALGKYPLAANRLREALKLKPEWQSERYDVRGLYGNPADLVAIVEELKHLEQRNPQAADLILLRGYLDRGE